MSKSKAYDEIHLWPIFSRYIRLRDTDKDGYGKCFTCRRIIFWKDGDCGHGIPRQHKATKYNERNNHLQCKHCNGFQGGKREVYKERMNKRYGENTWELMEMASKKVCKFSKFEYDLLIEHYKKEVERLKKLKDARALC